MAFDYTNLFSAWGLIGAIAILALIAVWRTKADKIANVSKFFAGSVVAVVLVISVYQTSILSGISPSLGKTLAVGDEFATGEIKQPDVIQPAPTQSLANTLPNPTPTQGGKICRIQSDGTNALDTAIRNKENSTLAYLSASSTAIANDGTTLDTATTTSGSSLSYVTLNVPGCQDGLIYVLGTAGVGVSSTKMAFSSYEETGKYEIVDANSNVIGVQGRTSSLITASSGFADNLVAANNGSFYIVSGNGATDGTAYFVNTTLSAGGSLNGYLDWTVNGTASVFGAYGQDDGALFSYDSGSASTFSKDSFSFSDLTGINLKELTSCPSTITANRNAEKCWSARALKGTDGEIRTKFQLKADLADPGASTSAPRVCVDDKVYFRDTNGKIAYDFFSSSGTNQGTGGTCVVFTVA